MIACQNRYVSWLRQRKESDDGRESDKAKAPRRTSWLLMGVCSTEAEGGAHTIHRRQGARRRDDGARDTDGAGECDAGGERTCGNGAHGWAIGPLSPTPVACWESEHHRVGPQLDRLWTRWSLSHMSYRRMMTNISYDSDLSTA